VKVEEQARRATAMDLHDGIGQELVGLSLTLKALGNQLIPEQRQLVDELRGRIDFMQSRTRELISDLSPPGLYDLGLAAALQWLVDELRVHNGLQVALDCRVDESRLWLELRVVAFKVARELLRNVAKHARVDHATLYIRGDDQVLLLSVQDEGLGFEWNPELHGNLRGGFGLLSVVERVAGEGGSLSVDTAPARGATFTIEFPLGSALRRGRDSRSVGA
jgi:signal transduction histidine kinase